MMIVVDTITVARIGSGTEEDPIRPDTTALVWTSIAETEDTFTIQIFAEG